jgi:hypothetical protein
MRAHAADLLENVDQIAEGPAKPVEAHDADDIARADALQEISERNAALARGA